MVLTVALTGEKGGGQIHTIDLPAQPLERGSVRVAIRAVSLNYRDIITIASGPLPSQTSTIPFSDAAGEIVEVGDDAVRTWLGEKVVLTFNPDWIGGPWRPSPRASGRGGGVPGVMRREIVVPASELVALPPHLSCEEGATLPCAAVTAWNSLCSARPLLPGMTVLVQGGGGVSTFATQFARLFGARVIALSSSPERCRRLAELGAHETVDYRDRPDWDLAVRDLTGGRGVDLALDLGGAATIDRSIAATAAGGRVAIVGLLGGMPQIAASLLAASVDLTPIRAGSRNDLEDLCRAMAFHGIRPVIDSVHSLGDLNAGLDRLRSGRHFGKVVVKL